MSLKDGILRAQISVERVPENSDHYKVKLKASLFKVIEESKTLRIEEHTGLRDHDVLYIQKGQYNQVIKEKCIDIGRSLIEKYTKSKETK